MTHTKNKRNSKGMGGRRGLAVLAVAIVLMGAAAAGGMAAAKQQPIVGPTDLPLGDTVENRVWIEGITPGGEWIHVESFSWGVTQSIASGGGGATGRADFSELHMTTTLSHFSPEIVESAATGKHIKKVILEDYTPASKKGNETLYLKITLEDVLISSYMVGGSSGSDTLPMEEISFNYAKITFAYIGRDSTLSSSFAFDLSEGGQA